MIIASVPYINALPLTAYIQDNIVRLAPAQLIDELLSGRVDVALLPIFSVLQHNLRMHPDAGIIGCEGAVRSVGFFGRPYLNSLSEIRSLYLDKESATSTRLAKIYLQDHEGLDLSQIEFVHEDNSHLADARMLIGDKALEASFGKEPFWDLGELWQQKTGTGFIFATWASKRTLSAAEIDQLRRAKELGLENREKLVWDFAPKKRTQALDYLTQNIVYEPNAKLKEGLNLYHKGLIRHGYL